MQIKIISKDRKLYDGEAIAITLPGVSGEFQVLEGHAPIFSVLKNGKILVQTPKKVIELSISGGISRVFNNEVLILIQR